mmetsp:Transcript_8629/g.19180  ORF Transcript_8629/g.19180 Transcript_8629/m.19180 type:complete len:310 (-) Transcript_8629:1457-2386(-)
MARGSASRSASRSLSRRRSLSGRRSSHRGRDRDRSRSRRRSYSRRRPSPRKRGGRSPPRRGGDRGGYSRRASPPRRRTRSPARRARSPPPRPSARSRSPKRSPSPPPRDRSGSPAAATGGGGGGGSGLLLGLRLFLRLLGGRESGALGLSRLLLGSLLRDEGLVAVGLGVPGLKGLLPLPEPSVEPLSGFDVLDTGGRLQLLLPLLHEGLAGALLGPVKGNLIEAFVFLRERKFHEVCVKGVGGEVGDLQLPERPLLLFVCQLSSRGIFIHGVLLRSLLGSGVLGAGVRHDGLELLGVLGFLLFHLLLC